MISKTRSRLYNTLTIAQVRRFRIVGRPTSSVIADAHSSRLPCAVSLPCIGRVTQKDAWRITKFCVVGLSGVGVATASLWLARDIVGLTLIISGVVAHLTSVTSNFIWNQIWTFNDRHATAPAAIVFRRWLKYLLTTLVAAGIYLAVLTLLTDVVGIHHLLSSLCGIAVATPVNFLASNLWVWKTAPEPQSHKRSSG